MNTLGGLIPICSSCKMVRDDNGYWSQVKESVILHTDDQFSHGYCLDCSAKAYKEAVFEAPKNSDS